MARSDDPAAQGAPIVQDPAVQDTAAQSTERDFNEESDRPQDSITAEDATDRDEGSTLGEDPADGSAPKQT